MLSYYGMHFLRLLRRSRLSSAYGPDWLVRNHYFTKIFFAKAKQAIGQLLGHISCLPVSFPHLQRLAATENRCNAMLQGYFYFFGQQLIAFFMIFSPFAMANQHVFRPYRSKHSSRDVPCISTLFMFTTVLSAQGNLCRSSYQLLHTVQMDKWGKQHNVCATFALILDHIHSFRSQLQAFIQGLVHLPVACYDFLSHA